MNQKYASLWRGLRNKPRHLSDIRRRPGGELQQRISVLEERLRRRAGWCPERPSRQERK